MSDWTNTPSAPRNHWEDECERLRVKNQMLEVRSVAQSVMIFVLTVLLIVNLLN